jgi:LacI family transcriptional regulator
VGQPDDLGFVKGLATGRQVEAVICANDRSAAMLIRSLEKLGIRVPRGIRVVGFDDVKYATLLSVQLTTMHQPCREIAVTAFRAMLDRIADPSLPPRSFVLTATLVVRESCGAYLPGRSR